MLVIKPTAGLCNRLRVVFSYYSKAVSENKQLIVIWRPDNFCPGFFLDYFKPIHNVVFIKKNEEYTPDYEGFSIHKEFPPNYDTLHLVESIESAILEKRKRLGKYVALHIRRTDHSGPAKWRNKFVTDESFFQFIDEQSKDMNVYVATDNKETFDIFKGKYKDSIVFDYHAVKKSLRKTTLHDAIVDLFMCIYAEKFKGSGWSSFTDFIETNRERRIA